MGIVHCHLCKKKLDKNSMKFTRANFAAINIKIPKSMISESRVCLDCFNEKKNEPDDSEQ